MIAFIHTNLQAKRQIGKADWPPRLMARKACAAFERYIYKTSQHISRDPAQMLCISQDW